MPRDASASLTPSSPAAAFAGTAADAGKSYARWLVAILAALTVVRLAGLRFSVVDLIYDESQYWSWSQDLALGYFSKPPLLAWLLAGWTHVCGNDEWCVRSPAPIIYAATSYLTYLIGRKLYGEQTGFWAGLLMAFAPGVVFSARIFSTDVPLLLFWSVALYAFLVFTETHRKRWAAVMGVSIGLGLLSKYAMIYFLPGILLASLASPRVRQAVIAPAMWLGLALALAVVSPNLIWNLANSFATFRHTGGLVLDEPFHPSLQRAAEFLSSQLAVMGPIVFPVTLWASIRFRIPAVKEQDRLMIAFFVTPIVAVTLFAIYSRAYANWAAPSIAAAVIAGTALLLRQGRTRLLWISLAIGVTVQITLMVGDAIATRLPSRMAGLSNPYRASLGWHDFASSVGSTASEVGARTIATDERRAFATLRYYLRGAPQTVVSWNKSDDLPFDFGHELKSTSDEPILFMSFCGDTSRLRSLYSQVEYLGIRPVSGDGSTFQLLAFRLSGSTSTDRMLPVCGKS